MTTNTTPTAYPVGTFTVQVKASKKGKMRVIDTPLQATPEKELYRKQTKIGVFCSTFDNGMDLLRELESLLADRKNHNRGIHPDELEPFLADLRHVIQSAWFAMGACVHPNGKAYPNRVWGMINKWGPRNQELLLRSLEEASKDEQGKRS
ncbi:MAG: hypothetical protein HQL87_18020 [Magnetococcales bacterium]|nr:hypothetical protein [Magnetococcales bacterium]